MVSANKNINDISLLSLDTIDNPFYNYLDVLYLNDTNSKFTGLNPFLINSNKQYNIFNNSNAFILTEKDNGIVIAVNNNSHDNENWYPFATTLGKTDSIIFSKSSFNSYAVSNQQPELYNSFVENNELKLRYVNLNLANTAKEPQSYTYLIDKDVSEDFCPIIVLPSNDVFIIYKSKIDNTILYGRFLTKIMSLKNL